MMRRDGNLANEKFEDTDILLDVDSIDRVALRYKEGSKTNTCMGILD